MTAKVPESAILKVVARAPFDLYFDGEATVVSAANNVGQFDILPGHADFFSVMIPCEVIIEPTQGDPVKFNITNGIVTVQNDSVLLFANM
jgi:F0F1-type ATP synthase epsilon subunit